MYTQELDIYYSRITEGALEVRPQPAVACFSGPTADSVAGNGTCSTPFIIDLDSEPAGTVRAHSAASGGWHETFAYYGAGCGWHGSSTARWWMYRVLLPPGLRYEASVDAGPHDALLALLDDSSCNAASSCFDRTGAGACEAGVGSVNAGASPRSAQLVVGIDHADALPTVHVRSVAE